MIYVMTGVLGFLVIHLFDLVSLRKIPWAKPVTWLSGTALLVYSMVMIALSPEKLGLPVWTAWMGWGLLVIATVPLVYSLFINLPFNNTYVNQGVGDELITTGLYSITRHPVVMFFILFAAAFVLVANSKLALIAAPIFIILDIVLVILQDKYIFPRMFPGYATYGKETPMLVPNRKSLGSFLGFKNIHETSFSPKGGRIMELVELLRKGNTDEVWRRCCGFIDLSIQDFMAIQKRLLLEQLEVMKKCELGRFIMNGSNPITVEEFRKKVPLTKYEDYAPYLLKRQHKVLPEKPILWQQTSGRSGDYPLKWIPLTERQYREMGSAYFAGIIFCSAKGRGDVNLAEGDRYLSALAPSPYLSGVGGRRVDEENILRFIPPLELSEKMNFMENVRYGFKQAMFEGMDIFGGTASVLVAIGERFSQGGGNSTSIKPLLRHPGALFRLSRAYLKSKLARRAMLPKDIWSLKGIIAGGTDNAVFMSKIKDTWGRYPLNIYACTEALAISVQTWDYNGMVFYPHLNFLEFIPEDESVRSKEDPSYQPKTVLLDGVKAGENYELVLTNFHGGALMRYRNGDMVKITALRNDELNIDLPQMAFYSRVDDLINIAGFTRLTEKVIWQAIERSGVENQGWTARKEITDKQFLHVYLEPDGHGQTKKEIVDAIHQQLRTLDGDYRDLQDVLGIMPLKVTLLPKDAFQSYVDKQKAAGAELARTRVPHINPPEDTLDFLINGPRKKVIATGKELPAKAKRTKAVKR